MKTLIGLLLLVSIANAVIVCPDQKSQCPDNTTCCQLDDGTFGCCPLPNAVCCSDHEHCCPTGKTCNLQMDTCDPQGLIDLLGGEPTRMRLFK